MAADGAQHLFNNLTLLHELKPGSVDFAKCIKENMFSRPNRTAFDQVLYYLCSTYDPVRYVPKVPWPILERSQERTFRQNTVSFVKDVIREVPQARLPPFSPSFLSTPGGERLTKFMWKLSLLVLKTVLERESDYAILDYPTAGLDIIQNLTDIKLEEFRLETDRTSQLVIDASTYAKKLSNDIVNQSLELKALRSEVSDILGRVENCPLTKEEKSIILDGDKDQRNAAFARWQSVLDSQAEAALIKLNNLRDASVIIKNCYESVKKLVDSKSMPLVLDATQFPSFVKDADGKLDLSLVLSEGAKAATSLLNSISACGGFQPLAPILPELEQLRGQLQTVEASLAKTKAGFMELLSESLENTSNSALQNDQPETPLKGSLQMGYEMLQDAMTATPPLIFDAHVDVPLKSRIENADSPNIDQFPGPRRPLTRGKPIQDVTTPKAPQRRNIPGLPSMTFAAKVQTNSVLERKDTKPFKGFQTMDSPMVQTPAFNPKQNATSTACKPSLLSNVSKKSITLSVPKMKTREISSFKNSNASVQKEEVLTLSASVTDKLAEEPGQAAKEDVKGIQKQLGERFPISVQKKSSNPINILKIQKTNETDLSMKSPQIIKTPVRSPLVLPALKLNENCLKDPVKVCSDPFDSPQSSHEVFSPPSRNNSFFSMDSEMEFPSSSVPKFDLDFDDDISPSGRVSLCPPIVEEVTAGPTGSATQSEVSEKPSSRRKSVNDLINRYRDLLASSKPYEPNKLSSDDLPEEISEISEEIYVQSNLNLDDLNFENMNV